MRLLQITDLHLSCEKPITENTHANATFRKFIIFLKERIEKLNVDYLISTGDISHDGSKESYNLFFNEIDRLNIAFSFIPGNHDDADKLNSYRGKSHNFITFEEISNNRWSILQVDSVVKGKDHGFIANSALKDLEKNIIASKTESIAIFLHHHLIPVGTPVVDSCKLENSSELLEICCRNKVRFIGTGHAHSLFQRKIKDILVSVSPAICSQWENGATSAKAINNSGFSIISLGKDIHVETYFI